jgi:hypothetical protein
MLVENNSGFFSRFRGLSTAVDGAATRCAETASQVASSMSSFVKSSFYKAADLLLQPVRYAVVNPISANIQGFQDSTTAQLDLIAQSYMELASTTHETVKTGSYLATTLAGAYLYDQAVRRQGLGDPFCKTQKIFGLSMAAVSGFCWFYRVTKGYVTPPNAFYVNNLKFY